MSDREKWTSVVEKISGRLNITGTFVSSFRPTVSDMNAILYADKVVRAAEREAAAARLYKNGGLPLQKRIDAWVAAQDELDAALAGKG